MVNQIECPVCGVMIEVDDNSGLKIECPNCHEIVVNNYKREKLENKRNTTRTQPNKSKAKSKKTQSSSDYMIIGDKDFKNTSTGNDGLTIDAVSESEYDEDGVKKELINALVEKDYVPSDIFEGLNIETIRKYYLPYQLFEGTYQVPWNAVYKWDELYDYVENGERKSMWQTRYGESNGVANGEFSYLCLACSEDNIPPILYEKAKKKSSVSGKVVSYSSDIEKEGNNLVVMPNSNFEMNWENKVAKDVLEKGKKDAEKQAKSEAGRLSKALGSIASLQNYNCQVNYDLKELQTILIPFWCVDYTYQNTHYLFVMDGAGKFKELEAPKNQEEIALVEENEKKKSGFAWILVLLLLASSIILGWMCSSWLVFIGLVVSGIIVACWAANKDAKVDDMNKEVRNENKKRRQELAQGLLSDLSAVEGPQLKTKEDAIDTKSLGNDDYLDSIV